MLELDLVALERVGSLAVEAEIPKDDPFWARSDLRPAAGLSVRLTGLLTASGEIVVRGSLSGRFQQDCRRCLEPVVVPVELDTTLVFVPSDSLSEESDLRTVAPDATELELEEPVREELVLSVVPYAICSTECRGLCPGCGANLNEETCQCGTEARDPLWDALRALKTD